jgi:adenosine deaminase
MFRLAQRHQIDLGAQSAEELLDRYRFGSFDAFLDLFIQGLAVLRTGEDFTLAVVALARELAEQRVRYAEITTTPFNHHRRGIPMEDYVAGLDEGRRLARVDHDVEISWICDIPRELEDPESRFTVDLITGPGAPQGVVALGLGGPEVGFPPELFANSFSRAKAAGLGSVPHAGETVGPASVWGAIRSLHADRIGHGVRAVEDPELLSHLAGRGIPLEVSMTSNVLLGVSPGIEQHQIRALLDAGVKVTLNTDDPAYFSTTLTRELELAHEIHNLSLPELTEMQQTAIEVSFASAAVKQRIRAELAASSKQ